MDFLADENVDRQIVELLRKEGHSVRAVWDVSPGITDEQVLQSANLSTSILLTADKDFGELVFRQKRAFGGIILLRLNGVAPDDKATIIASVVRQYGTRPSGAFTVVSPRAIRIRRSLI